MRRRIWRPPGFHCFRNYPSVELGPADTSATACLVWEDASPEFSCVTGVSHPLCVEPVHGASAQQSHR